MPNSGKKRKFLLVLLTVLLAIPRLLAAGTIKNIRTGTTYSTIQAAVDAAQPGDRITVSTDTYQENISIGTGKDGVTIEGERASGTFLNLTGIGGAAFTFGNVTGSTIRGFTIRKADVGIRARKSKPYVTNNIFTYNVNAFENRSSYSRVINNTFYGNTRAVFTNSSSTLKNNIIAGSGRYGVAGSRAGSIRYNLFSGNTLGNYSGISGPPATFNNITGNPLFVSPTRDFHLKAGSPAIDRGDPSVRDAFDNSTSDIGVYGGPKGDVKPATVTGVAATSSQTQVTVSWSKNLAYNISDHRVYYGKPFGNHTSTFVSTGNASESVFTNLSTNRRYYFAVRAVDTNGNKSDLSTAVTGAIDTIPPTAPTNLAADIGDQRLYLSWGAAADNESGVAYHKVYYGTSSGIYPYSTGPIYATSYELAGLTNYTTYYIAVSAFDNAGNESLKAAEVSGTPEEIRGIQGLKDTGGCFIATAAYGSYEAPYVKVLREFRDNYLIADFKMQIANCKIEAPNILGRAFVRFYYKVSPPVADFIRESKVLKAVVRVALLPVIGFAWMLLNYPLITLGLAILVCTLPLIPSRQGRGKVPSPPAGEDPGEGKSRNLLLIILLSSILLTLPTLSSAGERNGMTFGFSYGQIEPSDDKWKEIYEDDRVSNYRLSLGYWFRPDIGVEGGISYLQMDGKGRTVTGIETGADTTFQAYPVDLTVLYRLKYRENQLLVPYIGGGVLYEPYREKVEDGEEIKGGMWGHHLTGGLQLLLDKFDRRSARSMQEEYGIDNTYLALAATHSVIDDFGGEDVDLGGWNYRIGLLFEF